MITLGAVLLLAAASQVAVPEPNRDEPLAGKVSLTLTSTRNAYCVGETVRFRVEIHNFSDTALIGGFKLEPSGGKSTVSYRRGTSAWSPLTHLNAGRDGAQPGVRLDPDGRMTREFIVAHDPSTGLPLLNEAGTYEFRLEYQDFDGSNGLLKSNPVVISVVDVPSDQREALAAYRQGLAFFAEFHPAMPHTVTSAQIQAGADFLETFRGSLYWNDLLTGVWRAVAERVRSRVASDVEQALLEKIRDVWADTESPQLSVSPAPSSLWPPNHKLVPITIMVSVSDNRDPSPTVRLVSITCDDACSPEDIAEAALDTDDRDFELRAERSGSGNGRTYTIVYSATDAVRNITSVATMVVVPHDQGKK